MSATDHFPTTQLTWLLDRLAEGHGGSSAMRTSDDHLGQARARGEVATEATYPVTAANASRHSR